MIIYAARLGAAVGLYRQIDLRPVVNAADYAIFAAPGTGPPRSSRDNGAIV